jgi:UDP-N-acetyl-D-galactosamine dehydrogenase
MSQKKIEISEARILIMGLTFKENCPDLRNTRIIDLINGFRANNCRVDVYDPWVDKELAKNEYGIDAVNQPEIGLYDAIIIAVAHNQFKKLSLEDIKSYGKKSHVIYDIKYLLNHDQVDGRL